MSNEELNPDPMTAFFEALFEKVLNRALDKRNAIFPTVDEDTARKIAEINAKPYITIPEAELLYRCSDTYLYRCIQRAKAGGISDPIPFLFAGSYVLPQAAFFDWLKRQRKDEEKDCQESKGDNTLRHASLAARKGARR
jgi:hypothetical protein